VIDVNCLTMKEVDGSGRITDEKTQADVKQLMDHFIRCLC
jgi:hypothetical protein